MRTDATNPADAAYTLNRSMCVVANYRGPVLPVELSWFDGLVLENQRIRLAWATASENNNAGFTIEHATEGGGFEEIGFVQGAGTTLEAQTYGFLTEPLHVGTHRFKLKQIDFDGQFEYHPAIEITVGVPETYVLEAVYPNPFNPTAKFHFAVARAQHVRVGLHNVLGQEVKVLFTNTVEANERQAVRIDGQDLPSGVYMGRVQGENFTTSQTVTLFK